MCIDLDSLSIPSSPIPVQSDIPLDSTSTTKHMELATVYTAHQYRIGYTLYLNGVKYSALTTLYCPTVLIHLYSISRNPRHPIFQMSTHNLINAQGIMLDTVSQKY